jgi:hypothetical protein
MIDEATRAARAAEREARRKANQERWANDPANANHARLQRQAAVTPEVAAEAGGEEGGNGSASLQRMREIMLDVGAPTYRRLDAAECVLVYELSPGAAVGSDPAEIAAASYKFLKSVTNAAEVPEALRFRALRSIVAIENQRAQGKNTIAEHAAKRELLVALVNSERLRSFREAGVWPEVVKTDEWALKTSDDFPWAPGWPGDWVWPPASFAAPLGRGSDVAAFRQQLLGIKARDRDDRWEDLLGVADTSA